MAILPKINNYGLLSEQVYQILKNFIIEGDLDEGAKITEAVISKQLGVSTTPVREAIRRLVADGLITIYPNKKMEITKISIKDIIEVYQLRKVLFGLAVKLLAKKIKDDEIIKINEIFKEMEIYAEKGVVMEYSKSADKFHSLISHLSGNKRLENFSNILHEQVCRYRIKSLKVKGRIEKSLNEHRNILEALSKRDPEKSFRYCQKHLDNAQKNILENAIHN
jgi:DNA-binding GntR family transcriptional regulator